MKRRTGLAVAGTTLVVVTATGVVAYRAGGPDTQVSMVGLPTVPVVRTDLVDRQRVDGVLGYAGDHSIVGHGGVLTWLPAVGTTLRRGQVVYRVDGHQVPLFYASAPLWRRLAAGVSGSDVRDLQRNLDALGYRVRADGRFGSSTAAAVRRWRDDIGRNRVGSVEPGDVVTAPGPIRVTGVPGTLGTPAQGTILTASGAQRVVTVHLPVADQQLAVAGATVRVELPGGGTSTGRVASVGTVATVAGDGGGSDAPAGAAVRDATIEVRVTLDRPEAANQLDGAPVTVDFTSATRAGVLAVPVRALLAEGPDAYAVRVVEPAGQRRTVAVRLGMFAGGLVEVTGPGLVEGMQVEVPSS
ncbi:peptidoglycan-binding protein [Plantactinospora sp. B5E13]|uniref:peptidoglycan-binding protein n=1 Tax=unclassified Plantactinospora TaxID=2631981 RepID=UPI00325C4A0F